MWARTRQPIRSTLVAMVIAHRLKQTMLLVKVVTMLAATLLMMMMIVVKLESVKDS